MDNSSNAKETGKATSSSNSDNKPSNNSGKNNAAIKEKIEILKSLKNPSFDESKLSLYLKYASVPQMAKPILARILQYFIDLDSQISVIYETADDSQWEKILNEITEEFETKTKVDCLGVNFPEFYNILVANSINMVMEILSPIFKVKTKNIQFLVFKVALKYPKEVFAYIFNRMKTNPTIYCPYFSSLLVRLKVPSIKQKCFGAFVKYFLSLPQQNTVQYISLFQGLIYILCFPEFFNNGRISYTDDHNILDVIGKAYEMGLFSYINKDIGTKYCEMSGLKVPTFHATGNFLHYFPFDFPIIPRIGDEIEEFYIQFGKE